MSDKDLEQTRRESLDDPLGTPVAEPTPAEAKGEQGSKGDEAADKASILDSLDLARGEVDDDDLATLQEALNNLDFAARRASPERLEALHGLRDRFVDLVAQIESGVRRAGVERPPLTDEELARYHQLLDQGISAGEQDDLPSAARHIEEAVRLFPDGKEGLFNLGVVYGLLAHRNIAKGEFYDDYTRDEVFVERAQICYDSVLEQDPEHLPSLNNLATLYAMRDQREEAMVLLRRIVEIQPNDDDERRIVADAKTQLDELESY